MKKSKILKIIIGLWIFVMLLFVVYTISNEDSYSDLCTDGTEIDSDTGEIILTGGCESVFQPSGVILPAIIWLVVLGILLLLYLKK
jgi:hypothetical protein